MTKIYVVVEVTYDYFRFQENVFATTDLAKVEEFLAAYKKKEENIDETLLRYKAGSPEEYAINDKEDYHYWLQEFEVVKENKVD